MSPQERKRLAKLCEQRKRYQRMLAKHLLTGKGYRSIIRGALVHLEHEIKLLNLPPYMKRKTK